MSFENSGGELGVPLPAGIMRIYEDDSRGLPQFLGSDGIGHTPKNDTVVEPIPNDWRITQESEPHRKSSASTATWLIDVPAGGKAKLTYITDVSWCR